MKMIIKIITMLQFFIVSLKNVDRSFLLYSGLKKLYIIFLE